MQKKTIRWWIFIGEKAVKPLLIDIPNPGKNQGKISDFAKYFPKINVNMLA